MKNEDENISFAVGDMIVFNYYIENLPSLGILIGSNIEMRLKQLVCIVIDVFPKLDKENLSEEKPFFVKLYKSNGNRQILKISMLKEWLQKGIISLHKLVSSSS